MAAVAPAQTARQTAATATAPGANVVVPTAINVTYVDAKPVLETLRKELVPAELREKSPADIEAMWPGWV